MTAAGARYLLMRRKVALSIGCCDEGVIEQDHSLALRLATRARIGLTNTLVWQGPRDDLKRLMKNIAQHMHDYYVALTRFLGEFPVDRRYRRPGAQRVALGTGRNALLAG